MVWVGSKLQGEIILFNCSWREAQLPSKRGCLAAFLAIVLVLLKDHLAYPWLFVLRCFDPKYVPIDNRMIPTDFRLQTIP